MKNLLYYGDNLDVLKRHIKDESVDLVYLDPPFNSNRVYNMLFKEQDGKRSSAQIKAFGDTWAWDESSARSYEDLVMAGGSVADVLQAFRTFLGTSNMMAYLSMMAPRLVELRRVLKNTGSIYLHCDPTSSHYLKILMDAVFDVRNFRNEIVWCYTGASNTKKWFPRKHDAILFYTKGDVYTYNTRYVSYKKSNKAAGKTSFSSLGEDERQKRLEELDDRGKPLEDYWNIPILNSCAKERLGYPTQKPEALLDRIIKASTNPGDVVLDPFCGCGTAIASAQKLDRQWIGIDITYLATNLTRQRLQDTFEKEVAVCIQRMRKNMTPKEAPQKMHRRMTGKFHTPFLFSRMALEYMNRFIPGWRDEILFDPCAGTGNLEFFIGCSRNTWLATLEEADVDYLKSAAIAPADQCFQVDYLADTPLYDGNKDIPEPGIVLMNPPYGEAGDGVATGAAKGGIAKTKLKTSLNGLVSNELSAQFMFRAHRDHPNATVCLFSKAKFMCSPSYADFRKDIWKYKLLGGFCFPGEVFDGVNGKFPVLFTVWEPAAKYEEDAPLDIINANGEKIGQKVFSCPDLKLSDWIGRPKNDLPAVPLKNPITVFSGKNVLDRKCDSSLGYIKYKGVDVQNNGVIFCLSSSYGDGHGFSITPTNFPRAIMMWAVRKLVTGNWINDRDQYSIPHTEPSEEWQIDCLAFCLIHGSNQTSSLRGIEYDGKKWDVKNEWVVPSVKTLKQFNTTCPRMRGWLRSTSADSFVAARLSTVYDLMSDEGRACIDAIVSVWKVFFENAHLLDLDKFKIDDWDAGWWQIKKALKDREVGLEELKAADKARHALREKLLPGVYNYGFLPLERLS